MLCFVLSLYSFLTIDVTDLEQCNESIMTIVLELTKQSVSLGPVQPPAHSVWQHSLGLVPKQWP